MPRSSACTLLLATLAAAACGSGLGATSLGEANAIAVIAVDSVWFPLEQEIKETLEGSIFTVRDERAFEVGSLSPLEQDWLQLRRVRNTVVIGRTGDSWIADVLAGDAAPAALPALVSRDNVWARGQTVYAIVVEPGSEAAGVRAMLPEVADRIMTSYRAYVHQRMFASEVNVALQDTLLELGGFAMMFPHVYRWERDGDAFVFTNHSELTAVIYRTFTVVARPGAPDSLDAEALLAWRDSLGAAAVEPPQVTRRDRIETRALDGWPGPALEVQGAWQSSDSGGYPFAGAFLSRAYVCPSADRTFYVDAWLYLPDVDRPKHEYMIQLRTLLDSFRCAGSPTGESGAS